VIDKLREREMGGGERERKIGKEGGQEREREKGGEGKMEREVERGRRREEGKRERGRERQ
jgi:hypothetical protein